MAEPACGRVWSKTCVLDLAKSVLGLLSANPSDAARDIVSTSAAYGLTRGSRRNSSGWGDGLTILTAMANMQPYLADSDKSLALYHGVRSVAEDAAGQMPRIDLTALPVDEATFSRLREWFREFIEVRSDEAADRVLRTAISRGVGSEQLSRPSGGGVDGPLLPRLLARDGYAGEDRRAAGPDRLEPFGGSATDDGQPTGPVDAGRGSETPGDIRKTWLE